MVKRLKSISPRLIALLLAVFMVINIIPVTAITTALGQTDTFKFKVVDVDTALPIRDASVTVTPDENAEISITSPVTTDSEGIAEFAEVTDYFTEGKPAFDITYSVTVDGYKDVIVSDAITVSGDVKTIDVEMELNDTSNPTVIGIDGIPEDWTNSDIQISISATDEGRGVAQYKLNDGTWQDSNKFDITENGTYTVYAKDKSGNKSSAYSFDVSYIDKAAPVISSVKIDPETWTNDIVTLTVNATDDGVGIKEYKVDDGGEWQTSNQFNVSKNGTYTFYVRDKFDQESSLQQEVNNHDDVKPTIDGISCEEGWSNQSIDYTIVSSDDKSGVAKYGIALTSEKDDSSKINWNESGEGEYKFTITDTELYTFFVMDNAGNVSNGLDMTEPAKIEKISPVISDVSLSTEDWTNEAITFTVVASDEEGGSGISAYKIDDGEWQTSNQFVIADKEEHKFYVADNAGNESEVFSKAALNYDDTKPVVNAITLSTKEWTNQAIIFTVDASDEEGGSGVIEYKMDDGAWQTSNQFEVSDNNEHKFYVKDRATNISIDNDNNSKSAPNYDAKVPDLDGVEFEIKNDAPIFTVLNFLTFGIYFNKDEKITVTASDNTDNVSSDSGIAEYKITFKDVNDDTVKVIEQTGETVTFNYEEIENFKGSVFIEIIDNASNSTGEIRVTEDNSNLNETTFMIENDAPVITCTPENTYYEKFDESGSYLIYNNDFNVVFNVNDNQDAKEVSGVNYAYAKVNGVDVSVCDNGNKESGVYSKEYEITLPVSIENKTINGVDIGDSWNKGVLNFEFYAVDNAGNVADSVTSTYYIDQTSPVINGFDFTPEGNMDFDKRDDLYKAVEVDDYGFYFKKNVDVTVKAEDVVSSEEAIASGVKSITWFTKDVTTNKVSEPITVDVDENNSITFGIEKNFKGQIYAYATDYLNNQDIETGCVHPNGSVLEKPEHHADEKDHIVIKLPETKYTQNNGVALYSDDVDVDVKVKDEYAGIREIEWKVYSANDTENNYSGKLTVDRNGKDIEYAEGSAKETDWKISKEDIDINLATVINNTLKVSNNSNDIVLTIKLTDRAGNESTNSVTFGIDKTKPTIEVSYDNNNPDSQYKDFYKENRTATVTITERNFRAKDIDFSIANTDGSIPSIDLNSEKAWSTIKDSANPDNTKHIAKITYNDDGDYKFSIDYQDNAVNKAKGYSDKFTIDKTIPTVTVSYDNNSAQNKNYYKDNRIATISVDEHNFDSSRVKVSITTTDGAKTPVLVGWNNSGNIHTATISYTEDSHYTFDIDFMDMAGNSIVDYAQEEFVVDKTAPALKISGIVDESANADKGNIGFAITTTDTNFDVFEPVITAIRYVDGKFETSVINPGAISNVANGSSYVVNNISEDGVYKISCSVIDKAGNPYTEVTLVDINGKEYIQERKAGDTLLTFSVNRKGSVFYVEDYTEEILDRYYIQNAEKNIEIIEINPDKIIESDVIVNGKAITYGEDYNVSLNKNDGSWHKYTYSIKTDVFENENEYNIVVSSVDKAKNQAFSDIKDVSVKFVVDRTAPVVTVAGLKTNGRYKTDKQTVTVAPSDDGGMLKSLKISTVDDNEKVINELVSLEGEDLLTAVDSQEITFELGEGLYQNVKIICEDAAGNVTGEKSSGEFYKNVSVSTNAFLIFWANRVARYSTIAGIGVVGAGAAFAIVTMRKKRRNIEE